MSAGGRAREVALSSSPWLLVQTFDDPRRRIGTSLLMGAIYGEEVAKERWQAQLRETPVSDLANVCWRCGPRQAELLAGVIGQRHGRRRAIEASIRADR
jgi:hypothetical protein